MTLEYIPCGRLPHNGPQSEYQLYAGKSVAWFGSDQEEAFKKNAGHPAYDASSISYKLNSLGYRCDEFSTPREITVVSLGCSWVFGTGLPKNELFAERFTASLSEATGARCVHFNLGTEGGSNDHIFTTAFLMKPVLKPDVVLVNFTMRERRDYFRHDGSWFKYIAGWRPSSLVDRDIYGHFQALTSPYDDEVNFLRNYKALEATLSDTLWLFCGASLGTLSAVSPFLDEERNVGSFTILDRARDHLHPGRQSHADIADRLWKRFVSNGGLASKAMHVQSRY